MPRMLKVQEIREIIKLVDQSSITEFVYEQEGTKIKMKKTGADQPVQIIKEVPAAIAVQAPVKEVTPAGQPQAEPEVKQEAANTNLHTITSPMVGTFYASPSPEEDNYVSKGSKVKKDSIVCIVEAMKLFNEIEAEENGEIVDILVKDGQLVEYGQALFTVKAE